MVQGEGEGSEMASGDFLTPWCIAQTMRENASHIQITSSEMMKSQL